MAGEQPVNTGIVQVQDNNNTSFQVPRLTSKNYNTWTILMESVLDAQGLWEVIDPVTGGAVDEKKNKVARAVLLQALPDDILLQVAKNRQTKDIWEALRVRFLGADRVQKARLATLKRELEQLRMKETDTIEEFAGKLSGFVSKFSNLGSSLEDEVIVRKLLDSVPNKYLQIVASIEQYSDIETMPFEEAIGRLKAYEERIRIQNERANDNESNLLLTKSDGEEGSKKEEVKKDEVVCKCCGRGSLNQSNRGRGRGNGRGRGGRSGGNWDKSKIRCFNCNEYGHYASECPKKESKEEVANLAEEYDPSLF
ncbi:putative RNA-directed DNA polymerase [Helianthus annuus]|uniref:RNA-directed DNA polymerase n=1 Tax=Helianthus annuus TaxID=4232 RepID=A0A9K3NPS4_HELAN|nr:uncharacterized protein LOC110932893 [Helianthus annuus]KAF5808191.1 putative RNA-directed DNA polymerase [Helianthus annuus]KAJ0586656.1 putative RNA-directed DNA polymerase [Helianthus annuus]KAJ0924960.1 putative RNA-directed DNA polymerase [Helianthus annuus]KAJ0929520.1 putative RNA-directed DNA polymerase [Helianthus annuus]